MLPVPTISDSSRSAVPQSPFRGPSWTRTTLWTLPTTWPSTSTTSQRSSSLSLMARSRDAVDEVVAGPGLQPVRRQVVAAEGHLEVVAHLADHAEGDAGGRRLVGQPRVEGGEE